jgi:hypothetical protein
VIFAINDQLNDLGISFLEGVLESLDSSLAPIHKSIKASTIWDVESYCDHGEYLIGVGFCVMQRYLLDVLQDLKIDQGLARDLGPKSKEGVPVAKLIHSAGNYWKHEPEWHIWLESLKPQSQRTINDTLHGRNSADYPLSQVLADLCGDKKLLLVNCIPYLKEWRQAVYIYTSKNV